MLAAASGHLEVARVLLDAGADHNAASQDGLTRFDSCSSSWPLGSGAIVARGWI